MKRILVKPVGTEMGMNKAKHRVKALAETSVEIWKEKHSFLGSPKWTK